LQSGNYARKAGNQRDSITIELILKKLGEGMSIEELITVYPLLTREDILAAISYSADVVSREK
jgi:uncharacterized protein (DUF433 family)